MGLELDDQRQMAVASIGQAPCREGMEMKLTDFTVLTFDCYGTLIDWETGLLNALGPWRRRSGVEATDDVLLDAFGRHESAQQSETPGMLYPLLLARVLTRIGGELGTEVSEDESAAFGASIGDWPAFPDTTAALSYLRRHYKLVILSNVNREGFASSQPRLSVTFDAVYTAQDVGSYKPDSRNFNHMLDGLADLGHTQDEILHIAQSLFHDHMPAQARGLRTVWIDRRGNGPAAAKAPDGPVRYDFRYPDLESLARAHASEQGA